VVRNLNYTDLGLIEYSEAWELQKKIHQKRVEKRIDDVLLLLEHPHTYTLGKTAHKEHLIGSDEYLKEKNISVFEIDRGGDITYHGPGQIVGYPVISLTEWKEDSHKYLRTLEQVIIDVLEEFEIDAGRNEKYTGVWIEDRKITAIGIKISRWVTMHGFAFNIKPDLSLFDGIVPCGIKDKNVTSLLEEIKKEISIQSVKKMLLEKFVSVFEYESFKQINKEELMALLNE
jgi:lipoate-protein ligase B